jgi:hypothetical protein
VRDLDEHSCALQFVEALIQKLREFWTGLTRYSHCSSDAMQKRGKQLADLAATAVADFVPQHPSRAAVLGRGT